MEASMSKARLPETDFQLEPPSDGQARRAWVRHEVPSNAVRFALVLETGVLNGVGVNVSRDGVAVVLSQPLAAGTVAFVRCPTSRADVLEMPASVTFATPRDDGTFHVGCRFDRWLSEAELAAILQAAGGAS
jgi:hypothetical protein